VTVSDPALSRLVGTLDEPDLHGTSYRVLGRLGRGGVGSVFRVHDQELDREVALKVLTLPEPERALRLREEALVLARLEHPGIVPVHDVGVLADGRTYYVMKLVRGLRLDAFAKTAPLGERLRAFERICEAVAFAHGAGVLHRDLKPQNVMIGDFGEVLVLDWGVGVLGTPGYMAPEQSGGAPVDERSDVHGLGRILESLLADDTPRPLAAIARKAHAGRPDDRYPTVRELQRDVARFRDGEAVSAYS
jgi:serine/threonine protein kinase